MAKATWEGATLAESEDGVVVEGNYYFPRRSINARHFEPISDTTICHWKGVAHYYDIVVDGKRNPGAAWYYPDPKHDARPIKDHIAFWRGIEIEQ